ncbi:NAD(P)-dependent oxidoreductase [Paenibacillus xylanilyticus]|uniref:NAD(P)H-binding protein n=1 Tax=Paenibacillus xylanilyticus TaxID=248903 RepID=A0A7Y6BXH1_9BACL|nr:NAD(P)H-binding protein [Paenibacillus xylanilyticus]NUU76798.1 NAD(P)H-binding protein [Paenibacillus xylanilyticus]
MNIIIFGATGRTGSELLRRALSEGHTVTAFVRNPTKLGISHPNLKVEQGEVNRYIDIDTVLKKEKVDAVYSVLGAKSMFKRDMILIDALKNIIQAMEKSDAGKLIHVSFIGAHREAGKLGFLYKYVIPNIMTNLLRDHRDKDALVTQSKLNWILVQPPVLTMGDYNGKYVHEAEIHQDPSRKLKLSRANLADFLLKQGNDSTYDRKAVLVTE